MEKNYKKRNQMTAQEFLKGKTVRIGLSKAGHKVLITEDRAISVSDYAYNILRQGKCEGLQYFEFYVEKKDAWIPMLCKAQNAFNLNDILSAKRIDPKYILLFDLDNTLIDTNIANNCAYKYALKEVAGSSEYKELEGLLRITRKDVSTISGITPEKLSAIIRDTCKYLWLD